MELTYVHLKYPFESEKDRECLQIVTNSSLFTHSQLVLHSAVQEKENAKLHLRGVILLLQIWIYLWIVSHLQVSKPRMKHGSASREMVGL